MFEIKSSVGTFALYILLALSAGVAIPACGQQENAAVKQASAESAKSPVLTDEQVIANYQTFLAELDNKRELLRAKYLQAGKATERQKILDEARELLLTALTEEIFPAWYGTEWSYNGHTEIPRKGSIACGFFVTTVLKHVGFRLERLRLGRQPSEHIIKNLTDEANIRRFSNRPVEEVKQAVIDWGRGLYIVGLDDHVGFLVHTGEGCPQFVHCSFVHPGKALTEDIDTDNPLAWSRYRVIGKILTNQMLEKWLEGRKFVLLFDFFRATH